ncbi:MAG: hypothetical protein N2595_05865, partial [bacterium]|nr:hypothetical protein [bacterium]
RVLVEAKVVSSLRAHEAYRLQLNAQLGAARLEVGYLATVVNNWHFELEEVLFDPALYARQRAAAEEFLRRVREDRPPLPEEYVAPESVDGVLVVPAGSPTAQRLERMAELLRTLEPLEKELSQLREQLKEEMDTAGCMKVRSESVEATLKVSERESLDTKALKAAHPDVVAPFVRVSTVKTLQLKIL